MEQRIPANRPYVGRLTGMITLPPMLKRQTTQQDND